MQIRRRLTWLKGELRIFVWLLLVRAWTATMMKNLIFLSEESYQANWILLSAYHLLQLAPSMQMELAWLLEIEDDCLASNEECLKGVHLSNSFQKHICILL